MASCSLKLVLTCAQPLRAIAPLRPIDPLVLVVRTPIRRLRFPKENRALLVGRGISLVLRLPVRDRLRACMLCLRESLARLLWYVLLVLVLARHRLRTLRRG